MATSSIETYGLLDRWQIRYLQELYAFHQVEAGYESYTPTVWIQGERDELARNINLAFHDAAKWLGYYPKPIYRTLRLSIDPYRSWADQAYTIPHSAFIQEFGTRGTELIEAGVSVTYSNVSGGVFNDTATITVTTSEITNGEPQLFFRAADGAPGVADERYFITPDRIYYNGSAYVFTVPRARLVTPNAQRVDLIDADPERRVKLSPDNASTSFAVSVDCYRVYTNTSIPARLVSSPQNGQTEPTYTTVSAYSLDADDAQFALYLGSGNARPAYCPFAVDVNVLIGKPLSNGQMDSRLEEMILRIATANLPTGNQLVRYRVSNQWQYDHHRADDIGRGIGLVMNPLGNRNIDVVASREYYNAALGHRGLIRNERLWRFS